MSKVLELQQQIKTLQEQVKLAEREAEEERKRARKETPRVWRFTLLPGDRTYDKPRAGCGVVVFHLAGEVLNKEACIQAGWDADSLRGGGMAYLFNTLNNRIVCGLGGGNLYIVGERLWGNADVPREQVDQTFAQLEDFLRSNPGGGDVTDIIVRQKGFEW